jgi:hypothetical protein
MHGQGDFPAKNVRPWLLAPGLHLIALPQDFQDYAVAVAFPFSYPDAFDFVGRRGKSVCGCPELILTYGVSSRTDRKISITVQAPRDKKPRSRRRKR